MKNYVIRPARKEDCLTIATLYSISSDGVANYVWTQLAAPGEDIYQVGERRYQQETSNFSYRNCWVVDVNDSVVGMMVAFPMYSPASDQSLAGQETDPVLVPYAKLEEYESYYICGVALFPDFRGYGIGHHLMKVAEEKCQMLGLKKLSLIVFEQNVGAKKLYESLGYATVASEQIVPHPLIHYTGAACLLVKHL